MSTHLHGSQLVSDLAQLFLGGQRDLLDSNNAFCDNMFGSIHGPTFSFCNQDKVGVECGGICSVNQVI